MSFIFDKSLLQFVDQFKSLGKLELCNKLNFTEHNNFSKRPKSRSDDPSLTVKNSASMYLDLDLADLVNSNINLNLPARSLQERTWSCISIPASDNSEINNNKHRHSSDSDFGREAVGVLDVEQKILNTYSSAQKLLTRLENSSTDLKNYHSRMAVQNTDTLCDKSDSEEPFCPKFKFANCFQSVAHRTPCVIPDIACFPDMSVVILDHYHNNIQMFGPDFMLLAEEYCEYPIGCCCIESEFVAVSLRRNGQVSLFRKSGSQLQLVRNINIQCNYYLWQLIYKCERLFVVCDDNNVHVIDKNGKEYFKVKSGIPTERGYIRNFDVSNDGTQLYLCEKMGLRCIDIYGKFKWLFGLQDLPKEDRNQIGHVLEDVCFNRNTLFCTQWISSKIFQVSLDGKFLRNVVIGDIEHPRALVMRRDMCFVTQFYPSMKAQSKRTIKVFKLEEV